MTTTPTNPGSAAAIRRGCTCPVLDNNHGKSPPWPGTDAYPEGAWYINGECPLHGFTPVTDVDTGGRT